MEIADVSCAGMRTRAVMLDLSGQEKGEGAAISLGIGNEVDSSVFAIDISNELNIEARCIEPISHEALKRPGRHISETLWLFSKPTQLAFGKWDECNHVGFVVPVLCLGQITDVSV
jgi:hypothetical protein